MGFDKQPYDTAKKFCIGFENRAVKDLTMSFQAAILYIFNIYS